MYQPDRLRQTKKRVTERQNEVRVAGRVIMTAHMAGPTYSSNHFVSPQSARRKCGENSSHSHTNNGKAVEVSSPLHLRSAALASSVLPASQTHCACVIAPLK